LTARLLDSTAKSGHLHLFMPMGVAYAFSLELYLKCLLNVEGSSYPETHNLEELFRNLPKNTKTHLTKRYKALTDQSPCKSRMKKDGFKVELKSDLEASRNAFVFLRYAYEGKAPSGSGFTAGLLLECIREEIVKKKPAWDVWPQKTTF